MIAFARSFMLIICALHSIHSIEQTLIWPVGYFDTVNTEINRPFFIQYKDGLITTDTNRHLSASFEATVTSISDSISGDILLYTNGCTIYNAENKIVKNGSDINSGELGNEICSKYGYIIDHSATMIPFPGNSNKLIMIHMKGIDSPGVNHYIISELLYSLIDLKADNGNGEVILKNILMVHGDLIPFSFTRHANGRDYWVITADRTGNRFYVYLIDPAGVRLYGSQILGPEFLSEDCNYEQRLLFSIDGMRCARYTKCGVEFFNFDRCSGNLGLQVYLPYSFKNIPGGDMAFSAGSNYLFVSNWDEVIRISISDLGVSLKPFIIHPMKSGYMAHQLMLLPDGKIIINIPNSEKYLHLINNAEDQTDFSIEENAIKLPYSIMRSMPYLTVKDAGNLIDSACDTLIVNQLNYNGTGFVKLRSNIVKDELIIENKNDFVSMECRLIDMNGIVLTSKKLANHPANINVTNLIPGIYFIELKSRKRTYYAKWIKI